MQFSHELSHELIADSFLWLFSGLYSIGLFVFKPVAVLITVAL